MSFFTHANIQAKWNEMKEKVKNFVLRKHKKKANKYNFKLKKSLDILD